jgi:hypothetical protein
MMIGKLNTYCRAGIACARNLFFYSSASFKRSQDFIREIHNLEYVRCTANPLLREVSLSDIVSRYDFREISIVEYEGRGVDIRNGAYHSMPSRS